MKTAIITDFSLPLRQAIGFAAAAFFLFACSDPPAIDYSKFAEPEDGADGTACIVEKGTEHAYDIFCADTLAGYLDDGADGAKGADGADGADGESCEVRDYAIYCGDDFVGNLKGQDGADGRDGDNCSVSEVTVADVPYYAEGYDLKIACGESVEYLKNGTDGAKGETGDKGDAGGAGADGAGCSVSAVDEADVKHYSVYSLKVTCEDGSVKYLKDGAKGADGTACTVTEVSGGYDVYCGGSLAGHLDNGASGEGCSVSPADDGEHDFMVTCGDGSVAYLDNGKDGAEGAAGSSGSQGSAGKDGEDGADCVTVESGNYYEMSCGSSSVRFPKAMCGEFAYDPATHFCDLANPYMVALICDGGTYNTATHYCNASDEITDLPLCGDAKYNPTTHYCATKGNGDIIGINALLLDTRDGKTYKTILIGTQIWMAENLNYNASGSWCYGSDDGNCTTYGRLYDWNTAMASSASSSANPSGVQGVCPADWHLPSDAEWGTLATAVGGASGAGTKLKARSGWNDSEGSDDGDDGNGTDEFGFSALPGGRSDYGGGSFGDVGNYGYWWSATEYSTSDAYRRNLFHRSVDLVSDIFDKGYGFSVRCVKD